jgi:hypothetical protein
LGCNNMFCLKGDKFKRVERLGKFFGGDAKLMGLLCTSGSSFGVTFGLLKPSAQVVKVAAQARRAERERESSR